MSANYHIVIEPDATEGFICYNTENEADVQQAVKNGGWEMNPEDAVRIFGEEFLHLVCPVNTKVSKDGKEVTFTPPSEKELDAEAAIFARSRRERLLAETDYLVMPDYPLEAEKKAAVQTYRQALRDITKQAGWPRAVEWPVKPSL